MRYTAAFRLRGALASAVAVEWTDAAQPRASNAGWEACVRLPNGDWRFADHDGPAAPGSWREPGLFANIGLRYRLSASGPWSPVSATRKAIVLGGGAEEPVTPPEEPTEPGEPGSGTVVRSRQALIEAIVASGAGERILIGPGTYDRFIWPKSTSHALTLAPLEAGDPPVMRGIYIDDNPDSFWNPSAQAQRGQWARNLTIDGLVFRPEILTKVKQKDGEVVDITGDDGEGYGWRADFSFPGVVSSSEDAGLTGLRIGDGCQDVVVRNCLFEHFAKGISLGRPTRVTVWNNEFSKICEDGVMIWGGTGLDLQYNIWKNSRGVSLKAAQAYGWKNSEPVHQDFFQIACNAPGQNVVGLTISNNVMYDDTVRVHGVLLNNAYVSGDPAARASSRHRDVVVENNFLKQTHTTALQLTNVVGLVARRNKVIRSRTVEGSRKNDVAIVFASWGNAETAGNMEDVAVQDNVSRKYVNLNANAAWRQSGNVTTNDEDVLPAGWVEIRPELANSGPRAGRYGQR
jgi:hypothetical protein